MDSKSAPIREGFHTITPSLTVSDGAAAIDFYKRAFDAKEHYRLNMPDGRIAHAELQIGTSMLFLCDENESWGCISPKTLGGSPAGLTLYVSDVDALVAQAVAAGGTLEYPIQDQPWGDRSGMVRDPFGFRWGINANLEVVPSDLLARRMEAFFQGKEWRTVS